MMIGTEIQTVYWHTFDFLLRQAIHAVETHRLFTGCEFSWSFARDFDFADLRVFG